MTNVAPSFWQKTLQSFGQKPVRLRLRNGLQYRGIIEAVGGTAVNLKIGKEIQPIPFVDLLECTEI